MTMKLRIWLSIASDTARSNTALLMTPQCQVQISVASGSVESYPAAPVTLSSLAKHCQWHCRVSFTIDGDTAKSNSRLPVAGRVWLRVAGDTAKSQSMPVALRSPTQRCHWHCQISLSVASDTIETNSTVSVSPLSFTNVHFFYSHHISDTSKLWSCIVKIIYEFNLKRTHDIP
jgi:hypothetical protein